MSIEACMGILFSPTNLCSSVPTYLVEGKLNILESKRIIAGGMMMMMMIVVPSCINIISKGGGERGGVPER
jgi:hypothetical protein